MRIVTIFVILILFSSTAAQFPRILWLFWDSGIENAPLIYQLCFKRINKLLSSNWEIRMLSDETIQKWVDEEEIRILNNFQSLVKLPFIATYKSDYLRLTLLQKYGGVWMDIGVILLEDLQWLFSLKSDPDAFNNFGDSPAVFLFTRGSPWTVPIKYWNYQRISTSPEAESWFIAALPQAPFLKQWRMEFMKLLFEGEHYFLVAMKDIHLGRFPYLRYYLLVYEVVQLVLQRKQQEYDRTGRNEIAVRYYGLWSINVHKGPFIFNPSSIPLNRYKQSLRLLCESSYSDLSKIRGTPRYLIKLDHVQTPTINALLEGDEAAVHKANSVFVDVSFLRLEQIWPCLQYIYILKGSLIDKFLISADPALSRAHLYLPSEIPLICDIASNDTIYFVLIWFMIETLICLSCLWKTKSKAIQNYSIIPENTSIEIEGSTDFRECADYSREKAYSICFQVVSSMFFGYLVLMQISFQSSFSLLTWAVSILFWMVSLLHSRGAILHTLLPRSARIYFMLELGLVAYILIDLKTITPQKIGNIAYENLSQEYMRMVSNLALMLITMIIEIPLVGWLFNL